MVAFVVAGELCSWRTACRRLKLARWSFQYRMRPPTSERARLITRLHELLRKYPRYGSVRRPVRSLSVRYIFPSLGVSFPSAPLPGGSITCP